MSAQLYTAASLTKRLLLLVLFCTAVLLGMDTLVRGITRARGEPTAQERMPEGVRSGQHSALLPESWARKALTKIMPTYPEEAVRLGVSGVVHVRFETSPEGEVVRIKAKPQTHPLLSKAVVDAVKDWKFKPWLGVDGRIEIVFSRLAFNFVMTNGVPHVEMLNPGPRQRATECLECSSSNKEMNEWRDWEEAWSKSDAGAIDSP